MDTTQEQEGEVKEEGEEKFLPKDLPKELPSDVDRDQEQYQHYNQVKTVLSWSAHGRPYIPRGRQFYMTALLITFLIAVILFLFSQYLLMVLVAALVFMGFAFSLIPPRNFHYRMSTEGVTIEDHFYLWRELYDFYFKRKEDVDFLHIRTEDMFPGELIISLGDMHRDQVIKAILPYLPYREVIKPTFMERSGEWLYKNFPLEKNS